MTTLSKIVNSLDTFRGFASNYDHALAHKGLLTSGIADVLHDLTAHADDLDGLQPIMASAAADDLAHAMTYIDNLRTGNSSSSWRYDQASGIRDALSHAIGHLQ